MRAGIYMSITAYGILLYPITSFRCLGRVLLAADNDWPVVVQKLSREWQKWVRLSRVLNREGVYDRNSGGIYMAVVQVFIL